MTTRPTFRQALVDCISAIPDAIAGRATAQVELAEAKRTMYALGWDQTAPTLAGQIEELAKAWSDTGQAQGRAEVQVEALTAVLAALGAEVEPDGEAVFAPGGWVPLAPEHRTLVREALQRSPRTAAALHLPPPDNLPRHLPEDEWPPGFEEWKRR